MNETLNSTITQAGNTAVAASGGLEQGIYSAIGGVIKTVLNIVVTNEQIALALFALSLLLFAMKWGEIMSMLRQYGTVVIVLAVLFVTAKSIGVI